MQIGNHLPPHIASPNTNYLKIYVPNLSSEVGQFPIGRFYPECDELFDHRVHTDLMND